MSDEQAVDEQEKDSRAQQEGSTVGRLKSRVKDLVGKADSDGEEESSGQVDSTDAEARSSDDEEQDQAEAGSGESSEEQDTEGQAESGEPSGDAEDGEEQGESDGMVGDFKIDDADPSQHADDEDQARAQIKKLEQDGPPENLADWPTGKAMYLTFGGAEGEASYEDAASGQLGPSSTRHHADGSVEVKGEIVDDPETYKSEKSVFDEADEIGMDKGAKDDDSEGEEASGEDGQQAGSANASSENADSESAGNAESDGSDDQQAESEATEAS